MPITSANYYIELSVAEGNTKQVFTNVDYIFKPVDAIWVLTETGWELAASDIFIRVIDGWVNILTGSSIIEETTTTGYNVVLDASMYDNILTDEDYNAIIE